MTDATSNLVGLVGVRAAGRPPEATIPTAAAVAVFLILVMIEVLRNAFNHLTGRTVPHEISVASFVVMIVTVGINLMVSSYESCYREERRRTDCQRFAGEIFPVRMGIFGATR